MDRRAAVEWEVQTSTLGGWENVWTEDDKPQRFRSRGEAQAELRDHLREVREAVRRGDMDEEYSEGDFRIVPVRAASAGEGDMDRAMVAKELVSVARDLAAAYATPEQEKMVEAAVPDLSRHLSSLVGTRLDLKVAFRSGKWMTLEGEIPDGAMGAFSSVMKRAYVKAVVTMEPMSDGSFFCTVDLSWESRRGGSNGLELATAWYQPARGKWLVEARN